MESFYINFYIERKKKVKGIDFFNTCIEIFLDIYKSNFLSGSVAKRTQRDQV